MTLRTNKIPGLNGIKVPVMEKMKTRLQHRSGITGLYVMTSSNGKIVILTEDNREYFAPANEFKTL